MTPAGSTLVIGAAVGYSPDQIHPFLASLRGTGYAGDVALLVAPELAPKLRAFPLYRNVTLLPVRQWPPARHGVLAKGTVAFAGLWLPGQAVMWAVLQVLRRVPLRPCWAIKLASVIFPPTETRYLHYRQFLRQRSYSRILLSDVRDVLFQSDPFRQLPHAGLAVSMESPRYTVATEPHNAAWVQLAYGKEILQRIGGNPVSCSGVTYGDGEAINAYLDLMLAEILALPLRAANHGGMDQGIHNVLLWTGQLGDARLMETLASPVATLGGFKASEVPLSADGRVLDRSGAVVSVLHQHDRVPALHTMLRSAQTCV